MVVFLIWFYQTVEKNSTMEYSWQPTIWWDYGDGQSSLTNLYLIPFHDGVVRFKGLEGLESYTHFLIRSSRFWNKAYQRFRPINCGACSGGVGWTTEQTEGCRRKWRGNWPWGESGIDVRASMLKEMIHKSGVAHWLKALISCHCFYGNGGGGISSTSGSTGEALN